MARCTAELFRLYVPGLEVAEFRADTVDAENLA